MDLFTILADITAVCLLAGFVLGIKVRCVQEERRKNSIKWKKRMFRSVEIYDLKPDEWTMTTITDEKKGIRQRNICG